MANIVFLLEHEEGHILPTFRLAQRLAVRGHRVSYIGLADGAGMVERQGFPFAAILEDVFPPGSTRTLRAKIEAAEAGETGRPIGYVDDRFADTYLGSLVRGEDLATAVAAMQPDLFLVSSLYPLHSLVLSYRFGLPVALITPWLRPFSRPAYSQYVEEALLRLRGAGMDFFRLAQKADPAARRLQDLTARFLAFRELVLCPKELDLPRPDWVAEHEVYHVEPSIDVSRGREDEFPWHRLLPERKLVYCSLGSQSQQGGRAKLLAFQHAAAEAARRLPDWQLVLSTGAIDPQELTELPEDAIAVRWVPQIPVLEKAALMITHGGLGTVKECIFHGVPMIVFPMLYDQPDNAARVLHHGLGLAGGDYGGAAAGQIVELVRQVQEDSSIRRNMDWMRDCFRKAENAGESVRLIEEVLAGAGFRPGNGPAAIAGSAS
jgi:zeaxanthin glucosyltransferase